MTKSQINMLHLVGNESKFKQVSRSRGGEYHGPCPFCGGKDRFVIQLAGGRNGSGRWFCRQCSPDERRQDAIAFVMKRDSVNYPTACRYLGLEYIRQSRQTKHQPPSQSVIQPFSALNRTCIALTDPEWQQCFQRFVTESYRNLHHTPSGKHLYEQYLVEERRLTPTIIDDHRLGYNPRSYKTQWGKAEVWLPAGIVIPWYFDRLGWVVRIRQFHSRDPKQKYIQPRGGANGLYYGFVKGKSPIQAGKVVIMTEGEFDAMVVKAHATRWGNQLIPVSIGSATGARCLEWLQDIRYADFVLLAFDADHHGDAAAKVWSQQLGRKARRLRPTRKDITEMVQQGEDLNDWIGQFMPLESRRNFCTSADTYHSMKRINT